MKNLLIMRHAKSDWGDSSLSDFDRPSNNRGLKTAPIMGTELLKRKKVPDLIISSPANRAKTTALLVAESVGFKGEVDFEKEFYFGSLDDIVKKIKNAGNKHNRIMVIGHNPTWESLAYRLSNSGKGIEMPTATIVSLLFNIESWNDLTTKSGELEFVLIPKELETKS
jgi:phosphohistidine phosphatase